jgi:N-acetylneuraminate synthase
MDKDDLKTFHKKLHSVIQTLGDPDKGDLSLEEPARKNARRSLVASRSIDEDQVITEDDITWKRPGFGISPKYLDEVIGKKASRKIYSDEIIYWDFIK